MQHIVPQWEFIEISESSGTIQNASNVPVEISTEATPGSGIILAPHESRQYEEMPKYVRALSGTGPAVVNVVSFRESGSGGGSDHPEETVTDNEVDDIFVDSSAQPPAAPDDEGDEIVTKEELDGIYDD